MLSYGRCFLFEIYLRMSKLQLNYIVFHYRLYCVTFVFGEFKKIAVFICVTTNIERFLFCFVSLSNDQLTKLNR